MAAIQHTAIAAGAAERLLAYSDGTRSPVEPKDAATVVLMRDSMQGAGVDIYLLRRKATMAFAGEMCVFPGGGLDSRDRDARIAWEGPSAADWAQRLGTDAEHARALVCAAVRETFEESGVLLAGPASEAVVGDTSGEDWERDRQALEGHQLSLSQLLERRGLVLRSDLLGVWHGWCTPNFEPKRYRTWFFVAQMPAGQAARDVSTESSQVCWLSARDAVEQVEADEIAMLPPTAFTCLELADFDSVDAVMTDSEARQIDMYTPQIEAVDGGYRLSCPDQYATLLRLHNP